MVDKIILKNIPNLEKEVAIDYRKFLRCLTDETREKENELHPIVIKLLHMQNKRILGNKREKSHFPRHRCMKIYQNKNKVLNRKF